MIPSSRRLLFAFLVCFLFLNLFTTPLFSHPGKLAADGCHYCRTHCDKWGEAQGERHCHHHTDLATPPSAPSNPALPKNSEHPSSSLREVVRVVDGDTLVLDGNEKIRLIGVDTPETVHPHKPVEYFGKEASAFTHTLCEGKKVRLEYDVAAQDKYGRSLAYVYLEDGTFVNAELIQQGYGFAYTRFPFRYLEAFRGYERQARESRRGMWK